MLQPDGQEVRFPRRHVVLVFENDIGHWNRSHGEERGVTRGEGSPIVAAVETGQFLIRQAYFRAVLIM